MLADFGGEFKHVLQRCAVLKGAFTGTLDDGSVSERITERNTQFDHARARIDGGEDHLSRGGKVRIAARYIGDERWSVFKVKGHGSLIEPISQGKVSVGTMLTSTGLILCNGRAGGGKQMSRNLIPVVLLLLCARPASAQWERIEVYWTGETGVHRTVSRQSSPHPLQFYLESSAERDPSNSLCLGCALDAHGQRIKLEDFEVEKSQRILGQAFGKQILEIVFTFRAGSAMQKIGREEAEREHSSGDTSPAAWDKPLAEWKSIIMQSSDDSYRELYFLAGSGVWNRSQSEARVLTAGGAQVLEAVDDTSIAPDACFSDGRWLLKSSGPWLIDFSAVEKEMFSRIPQGSEPVGGLSCRAITMEKLEVSSLIQKKNPGCKACDYLGIETIRFRLDGPRAMPVSASFKADTMN